MATRSSTPHFMYHCFPRRVGTGDPGEKGLAILDLIVRFGFLLTPEIELWQDRKLPPGQTEEYKSIAKRCCFTEIAEADVHRHAGYFGQFAVEFDTRVLCDLGALPVFYVPRTSDSDGYGPGVAIVTQLAHAQDLLERIRSFREFATIAGGQHPDAQVLVAGAPDGGMTLGIPSGPTLTIPPDVIARARRNPSFRLEIPSGVTPFGLTTGTLMNIFNILNWGIHEPDVLTGTVKALGSLFYSTERVDDPFLSHYQQREWRLISGLKKDGIEICRPVPSELRSRLVQLDRSFFTRRMEFPTGPAELVDQSRLFNQAPNGQSVQSLIRRVLAPEASVDAARTILANAGIEVEVAATEHLQPREAA